MSLTRGEILQALREYGQPVSAEGLAAFMRKSTQGVSSALSLLWFMDRVERVPHPKRRRRYLYVAKGLNS